MAASSSPQASESQASTADSASIGNLSVVDDEQGKRIVISDGSDGPSSETLNEELIIADNGCYHATAQDAPPILLLFPTNSTLETGTTSSV